MSRKFSLNTLTEGIRQRHLGQQNSRLLEKWSRTGLLRGLDGQKRENMAMLLENQAAQALRESSSVGTGAQSGVASGDLGGFTNIAFPIVRRVFGGLVANELVSIQPMSLPSGLLFYLDTRTALSRASRSLTTLFTTQVHQSTVTQLARASRQVLHRLAVCTILLAQVTPVHSSPRTLLHF
jgi:hypothetical protein